MLGDRSPSLWMEAISSRVNPWNLILSLLLPQVHLPSRQPYGLMQLGFQQSLWRQLHQVLRHPDLAKVEL